MDNSKNLIVAIPRESFPDEHRVAIIPDSISLLGKAGISFQIETGAGDEAGIPDDKYRAKGAEIISDRKTLFDRADVILQVRTPGANPVNGQSDLALMRRGQIVIGLAEALSPGQVLKDMVEKGITLFSMELIPRITRAQAMDVLSSQATVGGYKAVLLAAEALPRMFPMFMTAAGTIAPAKVFIIGAGVAGLQAIATAKRLGAMVKAYDIRAAVKEQVESLGARFVEMELEAGETEDKGGYARAMDETFYRKQRELMAKVVAESDVVIATAAVPGKKAPILITNDMIEKMSSGSVIIDLAAERGGNCEATELGKSIRKFGVTIIGPENLPATVPYHASQMYSKNIATFFLSMIKERKVNIDLEDEIIRETLVMRDGQVVHPVVRKIMGLDK